MKFRHLEKAALGATIFSSSSEDAQIKIQKTLGDQSPIINSDGSVNINY